MKYFAYWCCLNQMQPKESMAAYHSFLQRTTPLRCMCHSMLMASDMIMMCHLMRNTFWMKSYTIIPTSQSHCSMSVLLLAKTYRPMSSLAQAWNYRSRPKKVFARTHWITIVSCLFAARQHWKRILHHSICSTTGLWTTIMMWMVMERKVLLKS